MKVRKNFKKKFFDFACIYKNIDVFFFSVIKNNGQDMAEKQPESIDSKKPYDASQEDDRLSRITNQLFQQLKPCLPIDSIEKIEKELTEIEIGNHRLPLNTFAPFISKDIFPIESEEELKKKLSDGVRRTISLIGSGYIPVGKELHLEILATANQASGGVVKSRVPFRKIFKF